MIRLPLEQTDHSPLLKEALPQTCAISPEDSEEPGLPDEFHLWQAELLSQTFHPPQ